MEEENGEVDVKKEDGKEGGEQESIFPGPKCPLYFFSYMCDLFNSTHFPAIDLIFLFFTCRLKSHMHTHCISSIDGHCGRLQNLAIINGLAAQSNHTLRQLFQMARLSR